MKLKRKRLKELAVDVLVDRRKGLMVSVGLMTVVMALFAPQVQRDASLKSYFVTGTPVNLEYQRSLAAFGNDEYVIVGIRHDGGWITKYGKPALHSEVAIRLRDLVRAICKAMWMSTLSRVMFPRSTYIS